MTISLPEIVKAGGQSQIRSHVEFCGRREVLWFSVDAEYSTYLAADRADGFVVGLLPLAMSLAEDISIPRAGLSAQLYYNLTNYVIPLVQALRPSLFNPVRILPGRLETDNLGGQGVVTGYSAGIDSFATIAAHSSDATPPGYRVSHLIFNNVGSHGFGAGSRDLFEQRYDLIRGFAEEVGLPFIRVDSNLGDLLGPDFNLTHTIRNASAFLQLQPLVGKYLYSGTHRFHDCHFGPSHSNCTMDPALVHLLSTEGTEGISAGSQWSRFDKTALVGAYPPAYRYLNVCVNPRQGESGQNCSVCQKCCRTMLALELHGQLERFTAVFDLKRYAAVRDDYLIYLLTSRQSPYSRDLIAGLMARGESFTPRQRLMGAALRLVRDASPPAVWKHVRWSRVMRRYFIS